MRLDRRHALIMLSLGAFMPLIGRAQQNAGPYVPTPKPIVDEMLKLAGVRASDFLVDLGCGDGRIVITAAQRFGARGFGVDIDPQLVRLAADSAVKAGVADRVRFVQRDLFQTGLHEATVLTLYLMPGIVTQLVPKIRAEMKPGARVVSHDYPLVPWKSDRHVELDVPEKVNISGTTRTILFLYTVPARINGEWTLELPEVLGGKPIRVVVAQEVVGVTGRAMVAAGTVPLERLVVHGEDVSFTIPGLAPRPAIARFTGKASGDLIEGTVSAGGSAAPWRATRTGAVSTSP
jgi:SAM-dependent methyltransferase